MTEPDFPPHYIKLPPAVALADEEDSVKMTMALVLGLCWADRYRQSRPYTPDELAGLLKRSRATLYRARKILGGMVVELGDSPNDPNKRWAVPATPTPPEEE